MDVQGLLSLKLRNGGIDGIGCYQDNVLIQVKILTLVARHYVHSWRGHDEVYHCILPVFHHVLNLTTFTCLMLSTQQECPNYGTILGIHDQVWISTWKHMTKYEYQYRVTWPSMNINMGIYDQVWIATWQYIMITCEKWHRGTWPSMNVNTGIHGQSVNSSNTGIHDPLWLSRYERKQVGTSLKNIKGSWMG